MATDLQAAGEFYASATGGIAARMVQARLALLWPGLQGQLVLGLGYAGPYLGIWADTARCCIAAIPSEPGGGFRPPGACCLVEEDTLPFADLSVDRILLVHGLENAENARRLLREVWRVLRDDGCVLIVAPNRAGLWAHAESTPFGEGRPYSPRQIDGLLAASLFRVERRDTALYVPPTRVRMVLRGAAAIERIGRRVAPRLAGVTITEAVKDVYAGLPLRKARRRRLVLVESS